MGDKGGKKDKEKMLKQKMAAQQKRRLSNRRISYQKTLRKKETGETSGTGDTLIHTEKLVFTAKAVPSPMRGFAIVSNRIFS